MKSFCPVIILTSSTATTGKAAEYHISTRLWFTTSLTTNLKFPASTETAVVPLFHVNISQEVEQELINH